MKLSKFLSSGALLSVGFTALAADKPAAPVSHPTVRETIVRQLEADADVYSFTVFGTVLEEKLQKLTEQMAQAATGPNDAAFRQDYAALARELGLTQVVGIGYSSVPKSGGFENRVFFATRGERVGLMTLFGGAPHSFESVAHAPADADIFLETDVHLEGAVRSVLAVMAKVKPEAAAEFAIDRLTDQDSSGVFRMLLGLKGRATLVLRMGAFLPAAMQTEAPAQPERPLAVFVRIEGIGGVVKKLLSEKPGWTHRKDGAREHFDLTDENAAPFKPTLMIEGTTLYAASSGDFMSECLDQKKTGLSSRAEYQTALRELGERGNGVTYVSPVFFRSLRETLVKIQGNELLRMAARKQTHLLDYVVQQIPQPERPVVSITTNTPDGIAVRSWSPRSLSTQQFALGLLNPELAGDLTTAVVISAHMDTAQKREKEALAVAVRKNLEQVDAAAQRYFAAHPEAEEVTHADLVAAEPALAELKPAAGEDFSQLTVRRNSDVLEIYTADADRVAHVRPLTEAQIASIRENLALLDEAAALYFQKNPTEESMSAYSGAEFVPGLTERLKSVVGEDYSSVYVNKSDTELSVITPGGQTAQYTRDPQIRWKALKKAARLEADLLAGLTTAHTVAEAFFAKPVAEDSGEEAPTTVTLAQLKESAGVALPPGVTEEDTQSVTFTKGSYEVTGYAGGRALKVLVPLPGTQRTAVEGNLAKFAKAAAAYLQKNPGELVVYAGELVGKDKSFMTLPDPVVGEDYAGVALKRGDLTVSASLPTGHVISVPVK